MLAPAVCFNAFDTDGSGAIDDEEFMQLASSVQGGAGAMFPANFKRALEEFDTWVGATSFAVRSVL